MNHNQAGKRNRPQACATYCLNLTCPQSVCQLHFEQSKTSVEFKDWLPVLSLIEKSVSSLWTRRLSDGMLFSSTVDPICNDRLEKKTDIITSTNADFLDAYEIPKKRCRIQNNQFSQTALNCLSFPKLAGTREIIQSSLYQDSKGIAGPSIGEFNGDLIGICPSRPYNRSDTDCSFSVMDHKLTSVLDQDLSSVRRDGNSIQEDCFSAEKMVESPIRITADYERHEAELRPERLHQIQFEDELFWRNRCSPENANSTHLQNCTSLETLHDVMYNTKEVFEFQSHCHESGGDYTIHRGDELADIDSELIPSREEFMKSLFSTRKHNNFLDDQVSSQEVNECPLMAVVSPRSHEQDPSLRNYLPSKLQDVNGLFLRNCSSLKNANGLSDEKWSEFQSDDRVQRADFMKFHGVNENSDRFQRTMCQDDELIPFPCNESKDRTARSKLFYDLKYAASGHNECRSVQELGGVEATFELSDTDCKDVISYSTFGVNSWDFEHQNLHEQEGNDQSRNHAKFEHFEHEKKEFDSCDVNERFTYEEYVAKGHSQSHFRNGCERNSRHTKDFEHQNLHEQEGNAEARNHAKLEHFKHEKKEFDSCDVNGGFTYEEHLAKGHSNSHVRNGCERNSRYTNNFEHQVFQEQGENKTRSPGNLNFCKNEKKGFDISDFTDAFSSEDDLHLGYTSSQVRKRANSKKHQDGNKDLDFYEFDDGFTHEDYLSKGCSRNQYERPERSDRDTNASCLFHHQLSGKPSTSAYPQTNHGVTLFSPVYKTPSFHIEKAPKIQKPRSINKYKEVDKVRIERSHSAPPIHRGKKRDFPMSASFRSVQEYPDKGLPIGSCEIKKEKSIQQSSSQYDEYPDTSLIEGFSFQLGQKLKEAANVPDAAMTQNRKKKKPESPLHACDLGIKWRNGYPEAGRDYLHKSQMVREKSTKSLDKYTILDVSSGVLHLASDTIIPKSVNRKCLEASRVLMQVDKKFIPVVAGKTLAVIDQHAADERIRLEDLRHKVLSGQMKTVSYLDEEKEMMLPESVYQLLHNYANQITHWGWICNISQCSKSFTKDLNLLNRRPGGTRLIAVPCILGVNLSDNDLLEFIEQLADTDGSSTVPPSVLRVLNNKACRGAIMFGDALLPSECSLIVEELKRTSLCFQCAHGRPTMAPLINLEALHKQIEKLGLCSKDSSKPWHGLSKQPISLARSKQRFSMNE